MPNFREIGGGPTGSIENTSADGLELNTVIETTEAITSASNVLTIDLTGPGTKTHTMTENTTIAFSGGTSGVEQNVTIKLTQHASAAKTLTLPSGSTLFTALPDITTVGVKARYTFSSDDGFTTYDVYGVAEQ